MHCKGAANRVLLFLAGAAFLTVIPSKLPAFQARPVAKTDAGPKLGDSKTNPKDGQKYRNFDGLSD